VALEPRAYAANNRELFAWHSSGLIKPRIDETPPLSEAATAFSAFSIAVRSARPS
jgi:NADPH2:quinone reductase